MIINTYNLLEQFIQRIGDYTLDIIYNGYFFCYKHKKIGKI